MRVVVLWLLDPDTNEVFTAATIVKFEDKFHVQVNEEHRALGARLMGSLFQRFEEHVRVELERVSSMGLDPMDFLKSCSTHNVCFRDMPL